MQYLALPNFFLDDLLLYNEGLRTAITPFIGAVKPFLSILFLIAGTLIIFNEVCKRFMNADSEEEDHSVMTSITRIALLGIGLGLYEQTAEFLFFTPVSYLYEISKLGYEALNADHIWFESNPSDHDKNYGGIFGAILSVGFFGIIHFIIMILGKIFTSYIVLRGIIATNVYYLIGPFAIILAMIPRNEQVVKRLYLEAMSIALWPVLCTLIMSVISQLPFYKHDMVSGNGLMYGLWGIILEGMALFSMFGVADYANNLVAFSSNIAGKGMGNGIKRSITGDEGLKGLAKWAAGNTLGRTFNMVMFYNGSVEESFVRGTHTTWMGNRSGKELSWAESTPAKVTRSIGRTMKEAMSPYSRKQRLEQANQKAKDEKQTAQENKLYDLANQVIGNKDNNQRTPELLNQRMKAGREAAQKAGQNTSSNNKQEITFDPKFNVKTKDIELKAQLGDDNEVTYSGSRVYRGGEKVTDYSPMNTKRDESTIDQRFKNANEQREQAVRSIQREALARQERIKKLQSSIDASGSESEFIRRLNLESRRSSKGLRRKRKNIIDNRSRFQRSDSQDSNSSQQTEESKKETSEKNIDVRSLNTNSSIEEKSTQNNESNNTRTNSNGGSTRELVTSETAAFSSRKQQKKKTSPKNNDELE